MVSFVVLGLLGSQMPIYQNKSKYMNYSKYSKYKKNEQSVLLFGNDSRISSNQSFVMPSNTGLTEANKSTHNKTISQIDSKKDFSKINIEGRKMMNPFINPIKTHKRRIGSSYPL
jgi:hypothetical protein